MSNESSSERPTAGEEAGPSGEIRPMARLDWNWTRLTVGRDRIVFAASVVALVMVASTTTIGVVRNLPYRPLVIPEIVRSLAVDGTPAVVAAALVAVALATQRDDVRVGLLFAGVFGLLATISESATLPAIAAVIGGGALALLGGLGRPTTYREGRRVAVGALMITGVTVSLASNVGLIGASFRGLGGLLALAGLAALGVRVEDDWVALVIGILVFAFVAYASITRPYVVGSSLLVGFAIVDVPHLLAALAPGGGTAAAVAGLRRHEYGLTIGAGLLLFAGIPATLPRATAVLLGATLALVSIDRLIVDDSRDRDAKEAPE